MKFDRVQWVDEDGNFSRRLKKYNHALTQYRNHILIDQNGDENITTTQGNIGSNFTILKCELGPECHMTLKGESDIWTLALAWLDNDPSANGVLHKFYPWTVTSSYCPFIFPTKESEATCNSNINKTSVPIASLKEQYPSNHQKQFPKHLNGILTQKRFSKHHHSVNRPDVFSIHVIKNSVILSHGDVILGNNILMSYLGCKLHSRIKLLPKQRERDFYSAPMYDEVFGMSTWYCIKEKAYYHKMLEALPRIVPYLDFLKSNPSVRVHVGDVSGRVPELLNMLGIPSERLIGGGKFSITRARVVYLPQDTPCGAPQPAATALLAHEYQHYMLTHYQPLPSKQDTVILIHRALKRPLLNHEAVASSLEVLAQECGLKFVIFSDADGYWSMEATIRLFDRALMVVGPHGAGRGEAFRGFGIFFNDQGFWD